MISVEYDRAGVRVHAFMGEGAHATRLADSDMEPADIAGR